VSRAAAEAERNASLSPKRAAGKKKGGKVNLNKMAPINEEDGE